MTTQGSRKMKNLDIHRADDTINLIEYMVFSSPLILRNDEELYLLKIKKNKF